MKKKSNKRCAVIGVGQMGQHHARTYHDIAQLVAVADSNFSRAQEIAHKYGVTAYDNYRELLTKEHLDAVSVAVPTTHHFEVAQDTLRAGIPTLVEKPIAQTIPLAKKLAETAKKHDVALMVGHVERFNPALRALHKRLVQDVGEIITISTNRVGIAPPLVPNSHVALDLAIHDIDVVLSFFSHPPKSVFRTEHTISTNQKADAVSLLLSFDTASAVITANWITPTKIRTLEITGTKGFAVLDYIKQKLVIFDRIRKETVSSYSQLTKLSPDKGRRIHVTKAEPLQLELEYFIKQRTWTKELENQVGQSIRALEIVLL